MTSSNPDHYEVLGVAPDATADEIEQAYRRLASEYDAAPDKSPDANERFREVRSAYDVLSDRQLRALYDIRWEALSSTKRRSTIPAAPAWLAGTHAGIPRVPWGIPAILAALLIPMLLWVSSLVAAAVQGAPEDLSDGEIILGIMLNVLILDGLFVAAPAAFCLWRYRLGWGALGLRPVAKSYYWIPPVAATAAFVGTVVYLAVISAFGLTAEQDVDDLFDSTVVLPLAGVALVIVAPLAEEIFFRGFVFSGLVRPIGLFGAMAVSGLLFATFHVTDAGSALLVPPFAVIGFGFAWIYYKTGSLWMSIGTHFIFNLVAFALQAIATTTS